ncbi:MAG: dihydrofolate reductase [Methylocystaceae bacterium]
MAGPIISLLVAIDENRLIGSNGTLPWRLPADVKYFKDITMGHPIVMGRRTWESLPKRPLPGRENIVLSSNLEYEAPGAKIINHPEELEEMFSQEEVFVIGGGMVFKHFLPMADRLYITEIDHQFTGDTYFPVFEVNDWEITSAREGEVTPDNPYPHRYLIYERKR